MEFSHLEFEPESKLGMLSSGGLGSSLGALQEELSRFPKSGVSPRQKGLRGTEMAPTNPTSSNSMTTPLTPGA